MWLGTCTSLGSGTITARQPRGYYEEMPGRASN